MALILEISGVAIGVLLITASIGYIWFIRKTMIVDR